MDSDSEESFYSAGGDGEDVNQRMEDVDDELHEPQKTSPPGGAVGLADRYHKDVRSAHHGSLTASVGYRSQRAERSPSPSRKFSVTPTRASNEADQTEQPEEILMSSTGDSSLSTTLLNAAEDLEDSAGGLPSSDPGTPSEPSTNSDKDSSSDNQGWDKLNPSDSEFERLRSKPNLQASSAEDWEKGWDETDITEEQITAVNVAPVPSYHSTVRKEADQKRKLEESAKKVESLTGQGSYWGKLGGWGTSLFGAADKDAGVSSLTDQFGQAFSNVFESVEKALGAPKPEDWAKISLQDDDGQLWLQNNEPMSAKSAVQTPLSTQPDHGDEDAHGWLADLTAKVQTSSKLIMSTGLDVLEGIGQKTMEVVQDKDPGLRQTKALLTGKANLPNLHDVLSEAKNMKSDAQAGDSDRQDKYSFVQFFTEEQGTTSWEALEILSKQCAARLESLQDGIATNLSERFVEIDEICAPLDLDNDDEAEEFDKDEPVDEIRRAYKELDVGMPEPHKLLHLYSSSQGFLADHSKAPGSDIELWTRSVHRNGVRFLAGCTAKSVEQIRKISEMLYLNSTNGTHDGSVLIKKATTLRRIVELFCSEIDTIANQYAECLALAGNSSGGSSAKNPVSGLITDIFVESASSSTYLQDALGVLAPILKLALVEGSQVRVANLRSGSTKNERS